MHNDWEQPKQLIGERLAMNNWKGSSAQSSFVTWMPSQNQGAKVNCKVTWLWHATGELFLGPYLMFNQWLTYVHYAHVKELRRKCVIWIRRTANRKLRVTCTNMPKLLMRPWKFYHAQIPGLSSWSQKRLADLTDIWTFDIGGYLQEYTRSALCKDIVGSSLCFASFHFAFYLKRLGTGDL